MWLDEVDCSGTETRLEQCSHHPWGKNNCNANENMVIKCHDFMPRNGDIYPEEHEKDLDTVRESVSLEGTAFLRYNNTNMQICGIGLGFLEYKMAPDKNSGDFPPTALPTQKSKSRFTV